MNKKILIFLIFKQKKTKKVFGGDSFFSQQMALYFYVNSQHKAVVGATFYTITIVVSENILFY